MVSLWALLAVVLTFVLYAATQFRRNARSRAAGGLQPSSFRLKLVAARDPRRRLLWISLRDCASILDDTSEVIVIDLRPECHRKSFPIAGPNIVSVHPGELSEILEWLPPERCAVFYGASAFCISLIQITPCMRGWGPVYPIADDPVGVEAA